jgi:hypothetical protein
MRYFIIDRHTNKIQEVNKDYFYEKFRGPTPPEPYEERDGRMMVLRASNGVEFLHQTAYCHEGAYETHRLWRKGRPFPTVVDPCDSISALEIVDDQLWLGTIHLAEEGYVPADGVVVQSLRKPVRIRKIGPKEGLAGCMIRVIRRDPYTDRVWVATERGLNVVDRRFRVGVVGYLYEDFDPVSGRPTLFLSLSPRWSNPWALVASALSVRDPKAFYEAVESIPPSLRNKFDIDYFFRRCFTPTSDFLPTEMNVLVPFFIEAARSPLREARNFALCHLCDFKDEKIYEFLSSLEEKIEQFPNNIWEAEPVRECLDVYAQRGLIGKEQALHRIQRLVQRMRNCIASLRESPAPPPWPYGCFEKGNQPACYFPLIVRDAKSLQAMGDDTGIYILNEYFQTSPWDLSYTARYSFVLEFFMFEDKLIPATIKFIKYLTDNLHKNCSFPGEALLKGCRFFNPRHWYAKHRYGAEFAEAVLWVLERARDDSVERECLDTLTSQLANSTIREEFLGKIYPRLSEAQKRWADQALSKFRGPSRRPSP